MIILIDISIFQYEIEIDYETIRRTNNLLLKKKKTSRYQ